MTKTYIQADKADNGSYHATEILNGDLDSFLWNLEYGDVAEGQFQIWEYPSGDIFRVVSDRVVGQADYYATPDDNLWLPELSKVATNKEKVAKAYSGLSQG